jgi:mxaL protein
MSGLRSALVGLDRGSRAIALALLLLVIALVMPTVELPHDVYDYVVVFDISQSMNVEDYELDGQPVSRLSYAHAAARQALRDLPCGSRVGWAAFTGYRTVLLLAPVEVCENYNDLAAALDKVDGRMRWSNASEITKGVYWSLQAAQESDSHPDVVFMSDGQEAPPLDPDNLPRMLEDARNSRVHGWLIGVGAYTPSPIPREDEQGRRIGYWRADEVVQSVKSPGETGGEHLSAVREPHLQALAGQIGFEYAHLTEPSSLSAALRDQQFARRRPAPTDLRWFPAALAVLVLAVRFRPDRSAYWTVYPRPSRQAPSARK